METSDRKGKSSGRVFWIALVGLTAVAVSILTGMAGYALGLSAGSAEIVVEQVPVEVTREVLVTPETALPVPTPLPLLPEEGENVAGETAVLPDSAQVVPPVAADTLDFALFDEVWDRVERDFDGNVPADDDLLYSAIEGSLESLDDQFTAFIRPEVAARLREDMEGSVSGIGAFVNENDEGLFEIVAPIEGQPAMQAGLLPGDVIVAVDGESVVGLSFDEVILLVRGPSGTEVRLTVRREDEPEPLEFTIVRATFEVPVVEAEMLTDEIAYVQLLDFSRNADGKLLAALDELLAQNPQGLILDLRNNPGGFLDQSIAVADIFLPQGVVVYERNRSGLDQTFQSDDGDAAETIPLVVLVNEASASASEIVAGAIQDNGRGILIGAVTFGKGSVQTVHTLSDGSELRVTIARWYTPDNRSIDEAGITPDIEVESPLIIGEDDDPQIQRAIEFLQTGQ